MLHRLYIRLLLRYTGRSSLADTKHIETMLKRMHQKNDREDAWYDIANEDDDDEEDGDEESPQPATDAELLAFHI